MAWIAGSSFQYDNKGWTIAGSLSTGFARIGGAGQSGLAALEANLGAIATATYGIAAQTEIIIGLCHKLSVLGGTRVLMEIDSIVALRFSILSNGAIVVYRNATIEIGRTAAGVINTNVEAYLEIRMKASTTVGEVEIRLNGNPTPVLNLVGVNTGNSTYDQITFIHTGGTGNVTDFSAWYLLNKAAATWVSGKDNNFLGHIRYAALEPTGNGNSSVLVGSDGNSIDNYLLVDDGATSINHDGDTTYVQSPTVGAKDTYAMENMPTAPLVIYAVIPVLIAKKTDAGTRGIKSVVRRSVTDYDGATEQFLGTSYDSYRQVMGEDPSTGVAWTQSGVDAMELGVKVTT